MKPQYLLPFKLTESKKSSAKITSFGGVPLILETYRSLGLDRVLEQSLCLKRRGWSEGAILEELITLQVAGGDCMDDVEYLQADAVHELTGYYDAGLPSSSAVRRFLHLFDEGVSNGRQLGEAYVPCENEALRGLNELHRELLRRIIRRERPSYITLDADASVVFSEKASCLATYKGGTGYQPIQAIWAEKGLVVAEEFRDGNVPASYRALEFLIKCERNLPKKIKLRIRSDGAWYDHDLMNHCMKRGHEFSISCDLSQGLMRFVRAIPEEEWHSLYQITKGGKIDTGRQWAELSFTTASLSQEEIKRRMQDYRYIIIRLSNEQPDLFEGAYRYEGIATNMRWQAERQIWWHYERCGTVEHVINVLKNDLGGGKFPCSTFGANAAWWRITCIVHNLVQCLKIIALPFSWFYLRMKRLRFRLFCIAGRIISHARQLYLQLGHPILPIYNEARARLAALGS